MWIWVQIMALWMLHQNIQSQVALLRTWLRLTRPATHPAATPSPAAALTGAPEALEALEVELEAGAAGSAGSTGCQGETKAMTATGEAKKTLQLMDLSQVGVWDGQFTRHGVLKQLMMIEKPRWIKNQGARPCPNQVLGKVLGNGTGMQEENQCIYIYRHIG